MKNKKRRFVNSNLYINIMLTIYSLAITFGIIKGYVTPLWAVIYITFITAVWIGSSAFRQGYDRKTKHVNEFNSAVRRTKKRLDNGEITKEKFEEELRTELGLNKFFK